MTHVPNGPRTLEQLMIEAIRRDCAVIVDPHRDIATGVTRITVRLCGPEREVRTVDFQLNDNYVFLWPHGPVLPECTDEPFTAGSVFAPADVTPRQSRDLCGDADAGARG